MSQNAVMERVKVFTFFLFVFSAYIVTQILLRLILSEAPQPEPKVLIGSIEALLLLVAAFGVWKGYRILGLLLANAVIIAYFLLNVIEMAYVGVNSHLLFTTLPLILAIYVLNVRLRPHFKLTAEQTLDIAPRVNESDHSLPKAANI